MSPTDKIWRDDIKRREKELFADEGFLISLVITTAILVTFVMTITFIFSDKLPLTATSTPETIATSTISTSTEEINMPKEVIEATINGNPAKVIKNISELECDLGLFKIPYEWEVE